MRDPATINAICWMIRNRRQVADIPHHCGGAAGLKDAIRHACVDGHVAYDEETERMMFTDEIDRVIPDWDALAQVVQVMCISEG